MDSPLVSQLVAIFVLILANGFFALSEFSIIASRPSRLKQKVREGRPGARRAEKLHADPDRFLATIQVGITLVGTLAGVFGGATIVDSLAVILADSPVELVAEAATPISVVVITVMITITTVVVGELVPKYLALSFPERYARYVARPVGVFVTVTSFFSRFLSWMARIVVRMLGVKSGTGRAPIGEDEINLMILEGREKGVFDETEERLIKSVFDFADSTVRRGMTPRTEVIAFDIKTDPAQVVDTITAHGHSRYPVYDTTIDNIIGVLYAKDIILHKLDPRLILLKDLIRKPTFVPDSLPASRLLHDFRRKKGRMAVVLDEFGGTAGIITLQDILEELVGEIQDEDDPHPAELVKHSDTIVFADGSVWPGAVNELMGCDLPEDKAETLAGLVIDHVGHLPRKNETVSISDTRITVLEQINNRLARLKVERLTDAGNTQGRNGRERSR